LENNEVRESQSFDLIDVAKNIAKEKGISSEEVITAMEVAIAKAGRTKYGYELDIRAEVDKKTGRIGLFRYQEVVKNIEDFPEDKIYKNYYAKGHYFKYSGKAPFSNLIYPVSGQHSLGIHVGFDLAGGMRFGPDVEFVNEIDYSFNESLKSKFIESISQYWPEINSTKLHPDYTGIRPKITKPNETMKDFSIQTSADHGIKNLINLQGIESPGLTSSLAIGKFVTNLL